MTVAIDKLCNEVADTLKTVRGPLERLNDLIEVKIMQVRAQTTADKLESESRVKSEAKREKLFDSFISVLPSILLMADNERRMRAGDGPELHHVMMHLDELLRTFTEEQGMKLGQVLEPGQMGVIAHLAQMVQEWKDSQPKVGGNEGEGSNEQQH